MVLGWAGKARGEAGWGEGCIDRAETGNNSSGCHFLNLGALSMLMLRWPQADLVFSRRGVGQCLSCSVFICFGGLFAIVSELWWNPLYLSAATN